MRERNFSPWAYWRLRVDTATSPPVLSRDRLTQLLGPLPDLVDLEVEVTPVEQRDGYSVSRLVFDAEAAMSVPARLFVPDDIDERGPVPAVVAVHGHGTTKETIEYAPRLAELGLVVLAPDLRGFGERADWTPEDQYHCDVDLVNAVLVGTTPLAQNLWDVARAIDVLHSLPFVDRERVGVCGWSYGGTIALFLAAWDDRVRAALVSCAFASHAAMHRVPWNFCGSQVLPGMVNEIDHASLAGLIAPRALIIESARDDLIFPLDAATASIAASGAAEFIRHYVVEGDHAFDGSQSLPAFVEVLREPATPN